jgi:predicted nucleic acid-binding protein
MVVIDAGPLVALFDRSEPLHRTCRDVLSKLRPPLITSWPALTDAFYFLKGWKSGQGELWGFILSGGIRVDDIPEERCPRIRELMEKFADRPMDFADASLVVISEIYEAKTIFTLDRHDFGIYRPKHTPHFQIIP